MKELVELTSNELREISGGVNPAYEVGYAIGSFLKDVLLLKGLKSLLFI